MALNVTIGTAQALDGREAAAQATRDALTRLGKNQPAFGIVVASHRYPLPQVLNGALSSISDVPLLGFNTPAVITASGPDQYSVAVALFSGADLSAKVDLWADYHANSSTAARGLGRVFHLASAEGTLLIGADSQYGDASQLCAELPVGKYRLAGYLTANPVRNRMAFQIGGRQSAPGALGAALLSGKITTGIGIAHGWQPAGSYFTVTGADGMSIQSLDGATAAEAYAALFGYPAQDWCVPPLSELSRLYPLGVEQPGQSRLRVLAPLYMDNEGSLRMNVAVEPLTVCHVMMGSRDSCLQAARQAALQALESIGNARPAFALLITDIAWHMLFNAYPGQDILAIRQVLGADVPLLGGYTTGQIARKADGTHTPELYNQHIQVVLFADPSEA